GGSVESFSSSASRGRLGNHSPVVMPAVVPLTSDGSVPSARSPVESFSSVSPSSSSDGRSGRLAVLLEDEDGMAVSGEREDAFPNPPAAAAAVITPSMADSISAEAAGGDNSAPDSWVPSHDG
ncbi:unnamed protein product, partial [Ectocarpus sp. 12 AP-2014]